MQTKVMYIQPYSWQCGPHQSLRTLVANLDQGRFLPLIVLPKPGDIANEYAKLGVKVRFDIGIRTIPRSLSPIRLLKFWLSAWVSTQHLVSMIRLHKIGLVHVNSEACWVGGFAAKITNIPAISHLHGSSVLSPPWLGFVTTRVLNRFNQALIATSNAVKHAYVISGAQVELIHVIYNGLNVSTFDPRHTRPILRSELGVGDGWPLVGMIANFDPRKGHVDFVAACAIVRNRIPQAQFVIVGAPDLAKGSSYYRQVQQIAVEHGLIDSIHFLGLRNDIPEILASLDVVVQPSLTEAGPIVPIEAMAMECPVVVTDVGGNPEEVVHGNTGLVIPVGDVHGLASAVIELLCDVQLAQQMGKAGRERVLRLFTEETHVSQVQQLYERLVAIKTQQ